jgi:hypothetical protein
MVMAERVDVLASQLAETIGSFLEAEKRLEAAEQQHVLVAGATSKVRFTGPWLMLM